MSQDLSHGVQGTAAGTDASDLAELKAAFPGQVEFLPDSFGMPVVKVRPGALLAVARFLRAAGFAMLLDVGGVDYLGRRPADERFEVVYHLLDLERRRRLRLKVVLPEANPELPSVAGVWPSANWAEREVYDLFGVRFSGHPNLKRILLPDGWEGHPLRKDYPLRGPGRTAQAQALRSRFFPVQEKAGPGASDGPARAPGGEGGRDGR